MTRRRWKLAARIVITLAILAGLFIWLPVAQLWQAMTKVGWSLWLLALLGTVIGHLVAAGKWRLLLRTSGVTPGFYRIARAHATGLFTSIWLPSLVGGDVVRAGLIVRHQGGLAAVLAASLADRIIDTAGLVMLAALGLALSSGEWSGLAPRVISLAAVAVSAAIVVAPLVLRAVNAERLPPRFRGPVARLQDSVGRITRQPLVALAALGLTLTIQSGFILINLMLGQAMGITVGPLVWFAAWPLAKLIALLPISLGGLGVREVALATLLSPFGVATTIAVAQSLVWETIMLSLGVLAGGLVIATRPPPDPAGGEARSAV